jgi:addiction module HigA family antidote
MATLKPVHPGEILREEFLAPLAMNPHQLSLALRVSAPAVYEIVHEERAVSPAMALRLAQCFGTTAEFWLNLQTRYDLEIARDKAKGRVRREVRRISKPVVVGA